MKDSIQIKLQILLVSLFILAFGNLSFASESKSLPLVEILKERSLSLTDSLEKRNLVELDQQLDPRIKKLMPASSLVQVWDRLKKTKGPVQRCLEPRVESMGTYKLVYVPVQFEKGLLDLKLTYSRQAKLSGLFIVKHKEAYSRPVYVQPDKFQEYPVRFGLEKWKLWGKLSVPKGASSSYPVCILVHGSGPQDMDESIGSNKPFLDIAQGLASQGVAALRYTKRTKEYKLEKNDILKMTVKDETIDDVIEAVKFLEQRKEIQKHNIFVLGHSLGGMLIPRIADNSSNIKGFVSLAGESLPMEDKIVQQVEYLASTGDKKAAAQISKVKKLSREIKDVGSGKVDSGKRLIMGASSSYWRDLNGYHPLVELTKMKQPVLFLQGARDYQVTAAQDFLCWKKAASSSPNKELFEFKLYPGLNHLFMKGQGKSTPQEYINESNNVSESVVKDIALWIKQKSKSTE